MGLKAVATLVAGGGPPVGGSGTIGKLAKFTAGTTIGDSVVTELSGFIGIGAASPAAFLQVNNPANNGAVHIFLSTGGSNRQASIRADTSVPLGLVFATGDSNSLTDRMFISRSTGNVGIGAANPTAALDTPASTATCSGFRVRSGTAPTSPNIGDIWFDGTDLKIRTGASTTKTFTLV